MPASGTGGAHDALAAAAHQVQRLAAAARALCTSPSAPALVLELIRYAPLYTLEITDAQSGALWLFDRPDGSSAVLDHALEGLQGRSRS